MDDSDFWFVITQWGYSGEDDRRYRVARFVATEHGQELEKGGILYKKSWAAQAAADHLNEIPVVVGEADENSSDC